MDIFIHSAFPRNVHIDPAEDVLFMPYSSGTTGLPKGVMVTHRSFVSTLNVYKSVFPLYPKWDFQLHEINTLIRLAPHPTLNLPSLHYPVIVWGFSYIDDSRSGKGRAPFSLRHLLFVNLVTSLSVYLFEHHEKRTEHFRQGHSLYDFHVSSVKKPRALSIRPINLSTSVLALI